MHLTEPANNSYSCAMKLYTFTHGLLFTIVTLEYICPVVAIILSPKKYALNDTLQVRSTETSVFGGSVGRFVVLAHWQTILGTKYGKYIK